MAENMSFGPEWLRNAACSGVGNGGSGLAGTPVTTSTSLKKLPLAEYRYGREEMLALLLDNPPLPSDLSKIPVLSHVQPLQPLAMIPFTEVEQHALAGNVNSDTAHTHNMRSAVGGPGPWSNYYSQRGRSGRGRGGRTDYHRPTTAVDEHPDRGPGGYYHRQTGSDAHRSVGGGGDGRGGGYMTRVAGSRSLSWRNTGNEDDGPWTHPWTTTPTSPAKPLGPTSGRSWAKEGGAGATRKGGRQFLPEWAANDDDRNEPQPSVGTFDNKGHFSAGEKDKQPRSDASELKKSVIVDKIREESPSPEDNVFDNGCLEEKYPSPEAMASSQPALPLLPSSPDVVPLVEEDDSDWKERHSSHNEGSVDSMEEMARRFEKTAEAVLFTEDEDTPSPSPNLVKEVDSPKQHLPPHTAAPESMQKWLYRDPRGEVQGPFSTQEMHEWFLAGYFTMDLMVQRVCDSAMLPLGQLIRIYGHIPFVPGPVPPPLQPGEQYWQQLFQHQFQLFSQTPGLLRLFQQQEQLQSPSPSGQATDPTVVSCDQATPIQQQVPPIKHPPTTEHSSIWSVGDEQQWPDILPQSKKSELLSRSQADQEKEKELKMKEELRRREAEEEKRRQEEIRRKKELEKQEREECERQRQEEERRRREEQQRREREEQKRLELERQEREKIEKERLEREQLEKERQQREKKELEKLIALQRLEEERQRRLKGEKREQLEKERQQHEKKEMESLVALQRLEEERQRRLKEEARLLQSAKPSWLQQDTVSPLHGTLSLVQIQEEEHIREQLQMEELRNQQQQAMARIQQQNQVQNSGGWAVSNAAHSPLGSVALTPGERPLSFLEIQQEQQQQSGLGSSSSGGHISKKTQKAMTNSVAPSSWSQIAAPSKQPPSSLPWGTSGQTSRPSSLRPTPTNQQATPTPLSFWEECALETKNSIEIPSSVVGRERERERRKKVSVPTPNSTRANDREEEKVRQLFVPATPDDEFTDWCARELDKFDTDVDAAVLTSLLLDVESTYEVHDYIRGCLGETDAVHAFAKQFLERRQKIATTKQQQQRRTKPISQDKSLVAGASASGGASVSSSNSRNSKKKKKKMQKVHPAAMLGFTVNAGERMNAGEIQSAKDAM